MESLPNGAGPGLRTHARRTASEVAQWDGQIQRITLDAAPLCSGQTEKFYGPEVDDRNEPPGYRTARELQCISICAMCPYRLSCLMAAIMRNDKWGVWGGWTKRQRKEFRSFLWSLGFESIPQGPELRWEIEFYEALDHDGSGSIASQLRHRYLALREASGETLGEDDAEDGTD